MSKKNTCSLFLLCFLLTMFCGIFTLSFEADPLWHIKLGEIILKTKSIPEIDTFSWYGIENQLQTFSHSWLGSIIIYLFSKIQWFGFEFTGVFLYQIVFQSVLGILIFFCVKQKVEQLNIDFLTCGIMAPIGIWTCCFPTARPQMISNLLFFLSVWILTLWATGENTRTVFLLPIITFVWANIHGGTTPLLLVFILAYGITGLMEWECGQLIAKRKPKKQMRNLLISFILSGIAIMFNPYGWKLLTYSFIFNNSACKEGVSEWEPSNIFNSMALGIIGIVIVLIILSRKKVPILSLVSFSICAALSLMYVRGTSYLGISFFFFILNYNGLFIPASSNTKKGKIVLSIAFAIIICLLPSATIYRVNTVMQSSSDFLVDDNIVATLQNNKYNRLYNEYNCGGHLIYSNIPVFIDSRADFYTEEVLREGKYLPSLALGGIDIIEKYSFDAILTKNNSPLEQLLKENKKFVIAEKGEHYTLYETLI